MNTLSLLVRNPETSYFICGEGMGKGVNVCVWMHTCMHTMVCVRVRSEVSLACQSLPSTLRQGLLSSTAITRLSSPWAFWMSSCFLLRLCRSPGIMNVYCLASCPLISRQTFWDYKYAPPCLASCRFLGSHLRSLHLCDKSFTTEPTSQMPAETWQS